ncbi:hypothetical protein HN911_02180 [Candidatus Bathyarchaeota archaeon]|nr:hypothetical protein [Candidatus Bathyarchaeota archaeon]
MSVNIRLGKIAAANISRAEVVVTGTGMTEIRQDLTISGNTIAGSVQGIPAGPDRLFTLNGYDTSGNPNYTGSASATVVAGQQVTVRVTVRSISGGGGSTVVLTIVSPVVGNYRYSSMKGSVIVTGEIENPSSQTAQDVSIRFTPRNRSGGPMDQISRTIGTVPPGRTFFSVTFGGAIYASSSAPISRLDYTITHSLGGPDINSTTVSAQ